MDFKNKSILITGGTGSFGSAFLDHLINNKILFKEVRIFSRDEKKQDDLRKKINKKNVKFYLGDVRDEKSLNYAFEKVDYIFHAAAYKQVPSCEFYPNEAIKTNVIGTNNVIEKAFEKKVKKVICLSTDKAVYPINAMGISKALMEKVAVSKSLTSQNNTIICVTRYGNVLASRGSVIPLMINQIRNKLPITITDPEMTRFIMPMNKAIELVLFAIKNGKNGDIFVPKTSATSLNNIAVAVQNFMQSKSKKIKIIGKRHGEKKHEYLMTDEEMAVAKKYDNYFKIPSDLRDLNYNLYFNKGKINKKQKSYSSNNSDFLGKDQLIKIFNQVKNDLINE